jgi:hypothetical protein
MELAYERLNNQAGITAGVGDVGDTNVDGEKGRKGVIAEPAQILAATQCYHRARQVRRAGSLANPKCEILQMSYDPGTGRCNRRCGRRGARRWWAAEPGPGRRRGQRGQAEAGPAEAWPPADWREIADAAATRPRRSRDSCGRCEGISQSMSRVGRATVAACFAALQSCAHYEIQDPGMYSLIRLLRLLDGARPLPTALSAGRLKDLRGCGDGGAATSWDGAEGRWALM